MIVFSLTDNLAVTSDLFVIPAAGGSATQVTQASGAGEKNESPAWAPLTSYMKLVLSSDSVNTPAVGQPLVYHIVVSDHPQTFGASQVLVDVTLPAGYNVTNMYADRGTGCAAASPGLVCNLDWISPGVDGHITITGTVGQAGAQTASATVTHWLEEGNPADNAMSHTNPATQPAGGGATSVTLIAPAAITGKATVGSTLTARPPQTAQPVGRSGARSARAVLDRRLPGALGWADAEDGYQAQRSYSIASAPEDGYATLTVEQLEDGEVSTYLVDVLRPGDELELRGPVGATSSGRKRSAARCSSSPAGPASHRCARCCATAPPPTAPCPCGSSIPHGRWAR